MERKVNRMKLKTLMFQNNLFGLLNITSTYAKELQGSSFSLGRWYDGTKSAGDEDMFNFTGMSANDRYVIDNFLKIKLGNSDVLEYFNIENKSIDEIKDIYNDIACLFKAREEQLNRQYYSILLKYNPIDNYDRTETQTHNDENTIGARSTTFNTGARSTTETKGQRIDSTSDSASSSPFDANDYSKATNKNETSFTSGAETDSSSSLAAVDSQSTNAATDSNEGGYTLRARGNIGTMTTGYMLDEFRKNALFNFVDELMKIIETDLCEMIYEC